ncbi:MAG TPA: hypothetical protein VN648_20475, partial [Candidatus Methylomirabilis sp.]|nr:hypothetical protein [Candidatus Methylomirabilis sp.]
MPRSRVGRVLVGFFLAALVLLVLSPIVALQVPAIRRQVQRWAESQLTLAVGRLVHVEHITLYPWKARLDLHQVRVASGQSLADGSLLTAESVHLGWSWRALLSRSLLFEQVVLVRPHVTLPTEGVSTAASGVVLPPLFLGNRSIVLDGWRIDIQSVTIENGQVTWEGNGSKESLDGLQGLIGLRRTPDGRASVIGNLSASRLLLPPGGPLKEIAGISIQADGDAQALTIASAEGLLAGARITAQGRILDPAGAAQCDLHLVLSSPLDALLKSAGFSTHVEGQLTAEGRLQGPWAHLAFQGKGSAQVSNAPARSNLIPFDLRWSNGRLEVDTSQADRPESLHAKLVIEPATGAFRARLKVGEADLDDLAGLPALVTQLVGLTLPAELGGTLTADLDLTGRGVDLTTLRGAGTIRVDDLSVGAGLPSGRLEARVVATTSRLALETFALDVPGA